MYRYAVVDERRGVEKEKGERGARRIQIVYEHEKTKVSDKCACVSVCARAGVLRTRPSAAERGGTAATRREEEREEEEEEEGEMKREA